MAPLASAKQDVHSCQGGLLQDAGGKLDVLVTNAGVLEQWRPIAESEPEEWWSSFEINIRGSYLAARAAIRSWLQVID